MTDHSTTAQQAVSALSHVAIRTRDIHESIRFYTQVLGLREAFRMHREDGSLATVYLYIAPGQFLELFSNGTRDMEHGTDLIGMCHICLTTPDIRRSYAIVRAAGGPIDREISVGKSRCLMFWTHDPDGTQLEIMELTPESFQAQANARLSQE